MHPEMPFVPRRRELPARRPAITFRLGHQMLSGAQHLFHVTVGLYSKDRPDVGEVFINTTQKAGSDADTMVSDAAVAISLALQYGCPLEVLRAAMKRNPDGSSMGLLSHVLDEASSIVGRP